MNKQFYNKQLNKRRKEEKKKILILIAGEQPKDLIFVIKEDIKERGVIDINSIGHSKKRKRILFVLYKSYKNKSANHYTLIEHLLSFIIL